MRVFLDTNVLASAYVARGLCADLIRLILSEHELMTGEVNLAELRRVLVTKFHAPKTLVDALEAERPGLSIGRRPVSDRHRGPARLLDAAANLRVDWIDDFQSVQRRVAVMTSRWGRLISSGLAAGLVINASEWAVHHAWLSRAWTDAFAALGKTPAGWTFFIPANFLLGIIIVWGYRWLSARYGPGPRTALRSGLAAWVIFWVIPTLAMQPLGIFPNRLLGLTILLGLANGVPATILGAWLHEGMRWPAAVTATTGAFRHSGRRQGIKE